MQTPQPEIFKPHGLRFGPLDTGWAHICVDMQRLFCEPTEWQTQWFVRVLPQVVTLAAAAPEHTFFTRFIPPWNADAVTGTWRRYYRRWATMARDTLDPDLLDLVPELARFAPPATIVDKPVYGPWVATPLAQELTRRNVTTVVVSGAETEVCVLATVLGAIDLGLRVIIATDAICSSADPTHDAMVAIYHNRFGMQVETADSEEIIEAIPRRD